MIKIKDLSQIDCFLLDMDGTIYLSNKLIEGVLSFLEKAEEKNKKIIFLTNNSSRSSSDYYEKLKKLNIPVKREQIINSGEVTANYIKEKMNKAKVYLLGTPSLHEEFEGFGLDIINQVSDDIDFLVLGFDTTVTYRKLWDAHKLILRGVPYLATNPDLVCPLEDGKSMPDCGSIINLLKTSTGKEPLVIGKPNISMVEYAATKTNTPMEKMAMVGDRIYTDMKMADNAGISGILVLSGETKKQDIADNNSGDKKYYDLVVKNLGELKDLI
ncbi:MAG: HAD-IIA family hydrolase [Bacillota bacterium]